MTAVFFANAMETDRLAREHYRARPDRIYPSFAGFPVYEEEGAAIVREKLEQGYVNIGEIAAASTVSPVVSRVEWKAEHPNDGLSDETALKVAYQNYEAAVERQPPTDGQIRRIRELAGALGDTGTYEVNKRMANELIFDMERRLEAAAPASP